MHDLGGSEDTNVPYGRRSLLTTSIPVKVSEQESPVPWTFQVVLLSFSNAHNGRRQGSKTPIHGHPNAVGYSGISVPRKQAEAGSLVITETSFSTTNGNQLITNSTHEIDLNPGIANRAFVEVEQTGESGTHPHLVEVTGGDLEHNTPITLAIYMGESGKMPVWTEQDIVA